MPPIMGPQGPLAEDIWVADLHWETSGPPGIGEPTNLTQRSGYDNQPHFTPDGTGLWYTAVDTHDGQADIWRYDFATRRVTRVTASAPESEYSATPLPDGSGISVIRVEADSTQRLWRFDHEGGNAAVLLEELAPVGYHAWADDNTLAAFVLGDPATLHVVDARSGESRVAAEDIGRSIQAMPGPDGGVSYVQRHDDGSTSIMAILDGSDEPRLLAPGLDNGEFHAWTPSGGVLLMASGSVVYAFLENATPAWTPIADFSHLRLNITRLAVSPDASQIALVAEVQL